MLFSGNVGANVKDDFFENDSYNFPTKKVKANFGDQLRGFAYTANVHHLGFFWNNSIRLFPSFINSLNYPSVLREKSFVEEKNKIISSKNNELICKESGFTEPKIVKELTRSALWAGDNISRTLLISCPDSIAKEVTTLLGDIYWKGYKIIGGGGIQVHKVFEYSHDTIDKLYWGNLSEKGKNRLSYSFSKNINDFLINHTKKSIINKFPAKIRKVTGQLFLNELTKRGIRALDHLSVFIFMNEMINLYLEGKGDYCIQDFYPQLLSTEEDNNNKKTFKIYSFDKDKHDFLKNAHKSFNKMSFKINKYTNILASIIFYDTYIDITLPGDFTLESNFQFYPEAETIAQYKASDLVSMSKNSLEYDNQHNAYVHTTDKRKPIDSILSDSFTNLHHAYKFNSHVSSVFIKNDERDEMLYNQYQKITQNIFTLRKKPKAFKNYLATILIPLLTEKAIIMNKRREQHDYILPDTIIKTAFLITQSQYKQDTTLQKELINQTIILNEAESIFSNNNFFKDMKEEDIIHLANQFSDYNYTIPLSLIQSTMFTS